MSADESGRERRSFALRVSLLFAAACVITGTQMPYLPVWLDWKGLSAAEIAVVTALPMFARIVVTPAIAFAADYAEDHRRFLILLAWAGALSLIVLAQISSFWPIVLLTLLFTLATSTIMPLTDTVAMTGVRAAGLDYGRMRLWGSLSFIAASFAGGWVVDRLGPGSAIWLVVAGGIMTVMAAHGLARPIGLGRLKAATSPPRLKLSDAVGLLRSPAFLVFLVAAGSVQAAHAVFYTFGTLHWAAQGLSSAWAGTLWAIGVAIEIALLAFSGAVVRRIGAVELIVLGGATAVLRWIVMGFDPPLVLLIPLQALHGITFGGTHIGAIYFMSTAVPENQNGTAQAVYASVTAGVALGGAMLLAGHLYAAYGGEAYWAMAVLAAVGLAASLALARMVRSQDAAQPQSSASGGYTSAPS
jgi:PPP family 3-phenylpropionic acid transporter